MTQPASPEIKASISHQNDADTLVHDMMQTFEAYRDANDQRLADIEQRSGDVLFDDKLARIDAALDAQADRLAQLDRRAERAARPALDAVGARLRTKSEHARAFESYVRSGGENGLKAIERKALDTAEDADGGYLVPEEAEVTFEDRLKGLSPMRRIASVRAISANTFRKPVTTTGLDAGWVAETAARPETTALVLSELAFPTMELYAMPAATATLLDDAAVDIEAWLAGEVDAAFAEQESEAFVIGNGNARPSGFLHPNKVDESDWTWGKIGTVSTGVAGDFPTADPSDAMIDRVYALKSTYRQNGTFVMNRKTQAVLRKMRDADGNYIWSPPAAAGATATLMGFPVMESEHMPDIGPETTAIAFGDFRRGYLIVDRIGTRVLRDPYSAKPYVLFYVTKRVGGGVQDFDAIKLLSFSGS